MADALAQKLQAEIISSVEGKLCPADMPMASFLTVVFSAKEAVYKALSQRLKTIPAFLDVILLAMNSDHLLMILDGQTHTVHYRLTQTDCVTLVAIDAATL